MSKDIAKQMMHEGKLSEALQLFKKVCDSVDPEDAESWCLAGALYGQSGDMSNAIHYLGQAVALRPYYTEALLNLANAYVAVNQLSKAEKSLNTVLGLEKNNYRASMSLAYVAGLRGESEKACAIYKNLYRQYPETREIAENLAKVSLQLGRFNEAEKILYELIGLGHGDAGLFLMMGNIKQNQGLSISALEFYQRSLSIDKRNFPALLNSGVCSLDAGLHEDAMKFFSSIIAAKPDAPKAQHALLAAYNYFPNDCREVFIAHRDWGVRAKEKARSELGKYDNYPVDHKSLRIGYMSPDFCAHSVAFFIEALLKNHNAGQFDIFCYADAPKGDSVTDRLRSYNVVWVDISALSDKEVVAQVRNDEIDVLVDLSGHTAGNRLTVFSAKPAALQVSYLGYPNTTGLTTIDYRLTDELTDPVGVTDMWYTEKLFRLKNSFLCYTPPMSSYIPPCKKYIPGEKLVFGSFNNISKITAEVIGVWSQILLRKPDSSIVFKHKVTCDENVRERLLSRFGEHGVDAGRIKFLPWTRYYDEHMEAYNLIDIALDPFPYNGTTTTFESLWMGVPVVALKGPMHAGRVGFSILEKIGMSELVAETNDAYVDLSVGLSCDPERLSVISESLRSKLATSSLCDGRRFTKDVENAYNEMWCEISGK